MDSKEQISSLSYNGDELKIEFNYASLDMLDNIIINVENKNKKNEEIELGKPIKKSLRRVVIKCSKDKYYNLIKYLYDDNYKVTLKESIKEEDFFSNLDKLQKLQICNHGNDVNFFSPDNNKSLGCLTYHNINININRINEECKCNKKIKIPKFMNINGNNEETFKEIFEDDIYFTVMTEPPIILNCGHIFTSTVLNKLEENKCPNCKKFIIIKYDSDLIRQCFHDYNKYLLYKTIKYNDKKQITNSIKSITNDELYSKKVFILDPKDVIPRMIHELRKKIFFILMSSGINFKVFGGLVLRELEKKFNKDYNIEQDVDIDIKVQSHEDYISIIKYLRNYYKCSKQKKICYNGMKGYKYKIFQKQSLILGDDIIFIHIDIIIDLPENNLYDFDINSLSIDSYNVKSLESESKLEKSILFGGIYDNYDILNNIKKKRAIFYFNSNEGEKILKYKINNRFRKIYDKGYNVNNIFLKIEGDKFKLSCGCIIDEINNIFGENVLKTYCDDCNCFNVIAIKDHYLDIFTN